MIKLYINLLSHIPHPMDTTQIIRRIMDLKKVSVELKQTTEDMSTTSKQILQGILEIGKMKANQIESIRPFAKKQSRVLSARENVKHDSSRRGNHPALLNVEQLLQIKKTESHTFQLNQSHHSPIQHSPIQQFKKSRAQATLTPPSPSPPSLLQLTSHLSPQITSQKITQIRIQNEEIESQLQYLEQQLNRLEQLQKQQQQQQWQDGIPFIILHYPQLQIFYTKLTIFEKDYNKIDYVKYSVDLSIDKIILKQIVNGGDYKGVRINKQRQITLQLSQLKQVQYHASSNNPKIGENRNPSHSHHSRHTQSLQLAKIKEQLTQDEQFLIIYYFKSHNSPIRKDEEQIIETLFVKFDSEEEYQQFDMGVFVNYKIIEDMSLGNQQMQNNPKPQDSLLNGNSFKEALRKYKENKEVDDQQIEKSISPQGHENEKDSLTPFLKKFNSNISPIEIPIKRNSNNGNVIKIRDDEYNSPKTQGEEDGDNNAEENDSLKKGRSDTSNFAEIQSPTYYIRDDREEEELKLRIKQKQEQLEEERRREAKLIEDRKLEAQRLQTLRKNQLELSIKNAKNRLKKGYKMTKYSKGAFNPHKKLVFLSEDEKLLCWKDHGDGDFKSCRLDEILEIRQGQFGEGIKKHWEVNKIQRKNCFVLITMKSKDRQTLELGIADEGVMNEFCRDLKTCRDDLGK